MTLRPHGNCIHRVEADHARGSAGTCVQALSEQQSLFLCSGELLLIEDWLQQLVQAFWVDAHQCFSLCD